MNKYKAALKIIFSIILVAIIINGCASPQQSNKEVKNLEAAKDKIIVDQAIDSARIHFYRVSATRGIFSTPRFHIDGKKAVKLPNGSISTIVVPAGIRVIEYRKSMWSNSYATEDLKFELDIEKNKDYYIKYIYGHVEYSPTGSALYPLSAKVEQYLNIVPFEYAQKEIKALKIVPPL